MRDQRTKVVGTIRKPDGHTGKIDGVVIGPRSEITSMVKALEMALHMQLWCEAPSGRGGPIDIEAWDSDGDRHVDSLRTMSDGSVENNLLRLHIWDRARNLWTDWQGRPL